MLGLENQVQQHEYEINTIKAMTAEGNKSLVECTTAMRDLTIQFATYTERHDNTEKLLASMTSSISELSKSTQKHAVEIATMKPTVESVRGLAWKMIAAIITGIGGASVVVTALSGV